jgi:hypothetical protein
MIEIYPIQLQKDDNPDEWVIYTNSLRTGAIQYDSDAHGGKVAGVFAGGVGNPFSRIKVNENNRSESCRRRINF